MSPIPNPHLRQSLESQHRIVRLNNDITRLALVGEDAVRLDELFAVPVCDVCDPRVGQHRYGG